MDRHPTVQFLLETYPTSQDLFGALSEISPQSAGGIESEINEFLAHRLFFRLLNATKSASNFETIEARLGNLLNLDEGKGAELSRLISRTVVQMESSGSSLRSGFSSLPYPLRRRLLDRQNNRCGVCGVRFDRTEPDSHQKWSPTLDHKIPYMLGTDHEENLWVLCRLCNSIKSSYLHSCERGRTWENNIVYGYRERTIAFLTMFRDKRCMLDECHSGPKDARLYATYDRNQDMPVLDTCSTRCESCLSGRKCIEF